MPAEKTDITIFGASGFTGRLVAEYLTERKLTDWAMAGRNRQKLLTAKEEIGAPEQIQVFQADSDDYDSLLQLCENTKCIITTVGPYQLYGGKLLAACAETGTDYLDLNGEPAWAKEMIETYEKQAAESGARIILSAGFDSIPFDLGVWYLQQQVIQKQGKPAQNVKARVRDMQGGASGGTVASMKATLKASIKDPSLVQVLNDPFALAPGFKGPEQPNYLVPSFDSEEGVWAVPFIMAPINTKNVHRTNYLTDFSYGKDFRYDEMMLTTLQKATDAILKAVAKENPFAQRGLKPGEGPTEEERESGYYDILFSAELDDGSALKAAVKGDRDPGYGSTSRMISEAALTLIETESAGGIYTPGALFAGPLISRLEEHAGLQFSLEQG